MGLEVGELWVKGCIQCRDKGRWVNCLVCGRGIGYKGMGMGRVGRKLGVAVGTEMGMWCTRRVELSRMNRGV